MTGVDLAVGPLRVGQVREAELIAFYLPMHTATPGQKLAPLPEGGSYIGFIFARGNAPGQLEQALRQAYQTLEFQIAATLPVMTSTTSSPGERSPAEKLPPPQRSTTPSGGAGIPAPPECPGSDDTRS